MNIEKMEIWITCEKALTLFTDTDTVLSDRPDFMGRGG
jgi:hypothetical protein